LAVKSCPLLSHFCVEKCLEKRKKGKRGSESDEAEEVDEKHPKSRSQGRGDIEGKKIVDERLSGMSAGGNVGHPRECSCAEEGKSPPVKGPYKEKGQERLRKQITHRRQQVDEAFDYPDVA
jgi:hypothetical protein